MSWEFEQNNNLLNSSDSKNDYNISKGANITVGTRFVLLGQGHLFDKPSPKGYSYENNPLDPQVTALENFDNQTDYSPNPYNDVFKHKTFITNDRYTSSVNIQSKILSFTKNIVTCECLIDEETMLFENRNFPAMLFNHLDLTKCKYALISIKTNIGSMKVDIYNGESFVNKSFFESEIEDEEWNRVVKSDFIKPPVYNPK